MGVRRAKTKYDVLGDLTSRLRFAVLAGQAGACDNTYTLTGAEVGDAVVGVLHNTAGAFVALDPADWEITGDNEITDNSDTDYSCDEIIVVWVDKN